MIAVPLMTSLARRELSVPKGSRSSGHRSWPNGAYLWAPWPQSFGLQGTSASVAPILSATIPLFTVVLAGALSASRLRCNGLGSLLPSLALPF